VAGTIVINGGKAYTRSREVTVGMSGGSDEIGLAGVALSNTDAWGATPLPQTATRTWILAPGDGPRTVFAYWFDLVGYRSAPATDSITLDTVPPVATGPRPTLREGTRVSRGRLRVRLDWTGSDKTSGISRFELARSTDGGPWVAIGSEITKDHVSRWLAPGSTYRFRVRAIDRAGNKGEWTSGPSFDLAAAQEASPAIAYRGTWRRSVSMSWWRGEARSAVDGGAKATIRVDARSFAWVAAMGPGRGVARVYVNGTLADVIDLGAPATELRQVVFARSWPSVRSRTVTIRVSGTAGRARVDVDAFVWAR
jgi:hypothetical protein